MGFFGLRKSGPPKGPERVLAYLVDAQRRMAPLKIEDAQGREVPATLDLITHKRVMLSSQEPLDLGKGAETHLVFILDGLRFKAPTRVMAVDPPGAVTVELPRSVDLAERRKIARGYLSAREGATAMAMAGLFNPLASGAMASMGTSPAMVDEAAVRTYSIDASTDTPLQTPGVVDVTESGHSQVVQGKRLWAHTNAAWGSTFKTSYMVDWLNARSFSLDGQSTLSVVEQSITNACFEYRVHANQPSAVHFRERNPFPRRLESALLCQGITYTFMTRPLPAKWRRAFMMTSVNLEAYCAGNNIRLGIRVK